MAEARVTHRAAVRFLARVDQHVSAQVSHLADLQNESRVRQLELQNT